MNQNETTKANGWALIPIFVFLIIFLGSGFVTGDFYSMPAIVAFLIALTVALCRTAVSRSTRSLRSSPGAWGMRTSSPCA